MDKNNIASDIMPTSVNEFLCRFFANASVGPSYDNDFAINSA